MEILTRGASVRDRVRRWREAGGKVALVPTAGTLHKGHLRLIAEAQEHADYVVVSVFAHAPDRGTTTQAADRDLVQKIGPDVLFTPPIHEIYPFGAENGPVVAVAHLSDVLDGAGRPGHFTSFATVLAKMLNIVKPDFVVFGERDFQHLVIAQTLIDDLFFSVQVVACPVVREYDGLPFASGLRHLTTAQRTVAARLPATLRGIAKRLDSGERDYDALEKQGAAALAAAGLEPEYLAIRQASDLWPARAGTRDLVILAAARLCHCRLIDNLRVRLIDRF